MSAWQGAVLLACGLAAWAGPARAGGYDLDWLGVPRFVGTNYIDLAQISRLSKFRSSAGHDYSDAVETCRSMKHYFMMPDATAAIVSPVAGTVTRVQPEWAGTQVQITSVEQPDFTFILFHVALARPLVPGERLAAGQPLGTHVGTQTASDIAVAVNASDGFRLVSYFETLTDAAFAPFRARGIGSPAELVTSRAQRDAAPYQCAGETFVNLPVPPSTEYVALLSGAPPEATGAVEGPLTRQSIGLTLSPPPDVAGRTGRLFVGAVLPAHLGGGLYLLSRSGAWVPFNGCTGAPAVGQGLLVAGQHVDVVTTPSDLTAYEGTVLYAGYGLGDDDAQACTAMIEGRTYRAAYTVK